MGPQTEHFQKDEVVQKWYYCKIFLNFFQDHIHQEKLITWGS